MRQPSSNAPGPASGVLAQSARRQVRSRTFPVAPRLYTCFAAGRRGALAGCDAHVSAESLQLRYVKTREPRAEAAAASGLLRLRLTVSLCASASPITKPSASAGCYYQAQSCAWALCTLPANRHSLLPACQCADHHEQDYYTAAASDCAALLRLHRRRSLPQSAHRPSRRRRGRAAVNPQPRLYLRERARTQS
jgi:hypothetical protein